MTFLNEPKLISLRTFKWFQVLVQYQLVILTSVICFHTVYSIWPMDETPSGSTTADQSRLGCNANEEVLNIPQSSRTGASLSGSLVS